MAQIRIDLAEPLLDGMDIKFKAPCNCNEVTGLKVYYPQGDTTSAKEFTFRDTHGNDLTGLGNLFFAGTYVKVLVDTQNGYAYLQNADTNGYLESKLSLELLWENASPNSAFPAQTISLDLSVYTAVYVEAIRSQTSTGISGRTIAYVGGYPSFIIGSTDGLALVRRKVTATASGVTFTGYASPSTENGSTNEIPYRIYGIKGGFA